MPCGLNNFRSKVDKLDVDKFAPFPGDLKKCDAVDNHVVQKTYNGQIKDIENKIPSITNLVTTDALTGFEN